MWLGPAANFGDEALEIRGGHGRVAKETHAAVADGVEPAPAPGPLALGFDPGTLFAQVSHVVAGEDLADLVGGQGVDRHGQFIGDVSGARDQDGDGVGGEVLLRGVAARGEPPGPRRGGGEQLGVELARAQLFEADDDDLVQAGDRGDLRERGVGGEGVGDDPTGLEREIDALGEQVWDASLIYSWTDARSMSRSG